MKNLRSILTLLLVLLVSVYAVDLPKSAAKPKRTKPKVTKWDKMVKGLKRSGDKLNKLVVKLQNVVAAVEYNVPIAREISYKVNYE